MGLGDLAARGAHPPHRRRDRAVGGTPAEHEHPRVPGRVVDLEVAARRCRPPSPGAAAPSGRGCPGRRRCCRCRRPSRCRRCGAPARACPGPPTGGRASPGRAGTAGTRRPSPFGSVANGTGMSGRSAGVGDPPRLGAVGEVAVRQQEHRRAVLQRDPRRLDRGVEAVGRRRAARPPAPATRRCGRTSPAAGRPARSWSACRWTGPPRCTSTMTSGSSAATARPIVSDFSATPGPEVVVTPSAPPNDAPSAAPMPAISSSAWKVRPRTACAWTARAGCRRPA